MKPSFFYRFRVITLILILLGGLFLRLHDYATWPREGATFDEFAWTWLGMSIIQKGVPISWSSHPQYKIRTHYIAPGGARFWLVQPYLEHPPLFGLIAGGYALLRGIPDMYHVQLSVIRELALALGVVSIFLVYLLSESLYGVEVGLLSALFYAIMPSVVIGSRLVQNENFFVPASLLTLFFIHKYLTKQNAYYFAAVAILCGLTSLAKVPWVAITGSCVLLLFVAKKYASAILLTLIAVAIFSLFPLYGFLWDRSLYLSLWKFQLNRYDLSFDSIFALFREPYLVDRYYLDGWIYLGWSAFILLLSEEVRKHRFIVLGLLGYLFIFIFAIPNEPGHGWYRYPFYPYLAIALAVVGSKYFNKQYLVTALFLLFLGLALLQHTWLPVFGFSYAVYRFYIGACALGTLPCWLSGKLPQKVANLVNYFLVCFIVLLTVWSSLAYNEQ